jgi:hypothetical protein
MNNKHSQSPGRRENGRFSTGNRDCYKGWEALTLKRFGDNRSLLREWWIQKACYHSDLSAGYVGTFAQKFFDPGTPEEFMEKTGIDPHKVLEQALEFSLDDVPELEF